jgi:hypothetical protein
VHGSGIASDGVHSNGFSLVRRVVEKSGLRLDGPSPFAPAPHLAPSASGNGTLGEALLVPTRIYVQSCLAAARSGKVKGISHITGGGLPGNVNRVLPKTLKGVISAAKWPRPPVFDWVQGVGGVASWEMARTFNCGLGMVFVVAPEEVAAVTALLTAEGEHVFEIGSLAACAAGEAQVEIDGLDVWESAAAAAVRSINRPAPAPPDVVSIGARSAEQEALILQAHSRGSSVTETSLPPTAKKLYSGKVRDVYECKDGATLALVATDRQSAFDRILAAVPFKGQVLNQVRESPSGRTRCLSSHGCGAVSPLAVAGPAREQPVTARRRGAASGIRVVVPQFGTHCAKPPDCRRLPGPERRARAEVHALRGGVRVPRIHHRIHGHLHLDALQERF